MKAAQKDFYSGQHFMSANYFARQAQTMEDPESQWWDIRNDFIHTAYVSAAIIHSACLVEAYINEFLDYVLNDGYSPSGEEYQTTLRRTWTEVRDKNLETLRKYQLAIAAAGKEPFDRGKKPVQDWILLSALRNKLVHFEPAWEQEDSPSTGKLSGLLNRFELNPRIEGRAIPPTTLEKILSAGCARWSLWTSLTFVNEFCKRVGLDELIETVRQGSSVTYNIIELRDRMFGPLP